MEPCCEKKLLFKKINVMIWRKYILEGKSNFEFSAIIHIRKNYSLNYDNGFRKDKRSNKQNIIMIKCNIFDRLILLL